MTFPGISQKEADRLFRLEKRRINEKAWDYPVFGGKITIRLVSMDEREKFQLDLSRGRINFSKNTFQNRARKVLVLARLDVNGPFHRNPDGEEIGTSHVHLYREGYGDKWAHSIPRDHFANLNDSKRTVEDFMRYCNIVKPPFFNWGLFHDF